MGRRGERTHGKAVAGGLGQAKQWLVNGARRWLQSGWYYICMWINREEQLESKTDLTMQGSSTGK